MSDANGAEHDAFVEGVFRRLTRNGDVIYSDATLMKNELRILFHQSEALRAAAEDLLQIPPGYVQGLEHQPPQARADGQKALELEAKLMTALARPVATRARHVAPSPPARLRSQLQRLGITRVPAYRRWRKRFL